MLAFRGIQRVQSQGGEDHGYSPAHKAAAQCWAWSREALPVRLVPTWIWSVVSWGEGQADHSGEGWEAWPEMALTMPS